MPRRLRGEEEGSISYRIVPNRIVLRLLIYRDETICDRTGPLSTVAGAGGGVAVVLDVCISIQYKYPESGWTRDSET
jgi:hypothetical protein